MSTPRGFSVLVVEDEGIVAKDLQQTLQAMGYDAPEPVSTADAAIARAAQRCPDIVLMDIRIAGHIDGIEAAELLRRRFGVPVVFLTAHADDATLERAKRTSPAGFLVKPVKPADLRSAIEVALYRHDIERRVRERERWFSTTLRSIADAVITVDLAGKVTFMNAAAEAVVGVSAREAIGRPAKEIVRLDDPDHPASPLDTVLDERRTLEIRTASLATGDGMKIINDSASLVVDDGQVLGAVMVFRDVTEQRALQRKLELSDRLASLGTMAAGVVHEINNPLAVVMANAEFVMKALVRQRELARDDDVVRPALDAAIAAHQDLEGAAERISGIMSELRTFARPRQEPEGTGDVARAIAWAVRATAREFHARATVAAEVPAELPRVALGEIRLEQVVVNLLINAAHAIPPGHFADHRVDVHARVEGTTVIIEVRDTGSGIAREHVARVFEPFFTTKESSHGTGLGLAICHGIVTSVGGEIGVSSEEGRGATFQVRLPVAANR